MRVTGSHETISRVTLMLRQSSVEACMFPGRMAADFTGQVGLMKVMTNNGGKIVPEWHAVATSGFNCQLLCALCSSPWVSRSVAAWYWRRQLAMSDLFFEALILCSD